MPELTELTRRAFLHGAGLATAGLLVPGSSRSDLSPSDRMTMTTPVPAVKALVFDVFGTLVDWRTSIAAEVDAFARRRGITLDGARFADAWRGAYGPSMDQVRTGKLPWTNLDRLHRMSLDALFVQFGVTGVSEADADALNRAWHRLAPWPDVVAGLTRLKTKFTIAPLSNGNISLITEMAKRAGLPWDCVLGAELVRHYKPDREVYRSAADFLDLAPHEVMMVAAHLGDLRGAKEAGLTTAFIPRPKEYGPDGAADSQPDAFVDVTATDLVALAGTLGA